MAPVPSSYQRLAADLPRLDIDQSRELAVERKTDDGNIEITVRDLRERAPKSISARDAANPPIIESPRQ
jgi:hypothetical protein